MSAITIKTLNSLIKKIGSNAAQQRKDIQEALIGCAVIAQRDRNLDPAIRLFEAVGNGVYKAGMSKWLSLNAPVHFKDDKPLLSDARQKEYQDSIETFEAEIRLTVEWYAIDKENNKAPNVWDCLAVFTKEAAHLSKLAERAAKEGDVEAARALKEAHAVIAKVMAQFDAVEV